ncbi:MAG TPA: MarR family winged helix-turn-helix transcriptional regulator, partial [Burkholderiales bacterium]
RRGPSDADRRQVFVSLTAAGARLFGRIFPLHAAHVRKAFTVLSPAELDQTRDLLQRLRDALRDAHSTVREA